MAESYVIAHELGHNFSLSHAPCGRVASFDPLYPHADGSIGNWGYDFRDGGALVPPTHRDLMSYCNSRWISGYHFSKAARYRVADVAAASFAADGGASNSLLLWGGVDASGQPFLEPAFVVEAPAALPQPGGGEYELSGRTSAGEVLFSLNFDMPEIADGDGSSAFAFALPAQADWERRLVSVTLSGPGGATTLDGDTDRPMVILRNPRSGQVRGFVRKLPSSALGWGPGAGRRSVARARPRGSLQPRPSRPRRLATLRAAWATCSPAKARPPHVATGPAASETNVAPVRIGDARNHVSCTFRTPNWQRPPDAFGPGGLLLHIEGDDFWTRR